ncbi:hypothetical protein KKP06_21955 [Ralstonia pickettii]|uniref:hypothetical protein n=1 Tax=Ralstonia pickettii TaxID=329 RepID=UPI001BE45DCA|nr:hypothetical protein [Ralstonia pickettii]MBT2180483.1 hypothetical protein [Ralstonia pickettii]
MKAHDRKWGNLVEFEHYAHAPDPALARYLRVTLATIRAWRSGKRAVPWWVPELLRLRQWEHDDHMRRMGYQRLAVVKNGPTAKVYTPTFGTRQAIAVQAERDAAAHASDVADDWGVMQA